MSKFIEKPNEIVCSTPLKSENSPNLGCDISPITHSIIVLTDSPSPPPTIYSNVLNDEILGSSNLEVVKGEISPNLGCDISPSILVLTSSKSDDIPEAYWKKRLGLHESDRKTVRNVEWLTDKHINAARSLLKEQFPLQQGLQDTLLLQHGKYDSGINCLVQVIHINRNHWVCVSNKFSPKGTVDVFDCSSGNGNSTSLKRLLAIILKCRSAFFRVKHVEVQRQTGYADCGIFAIAFAYTLYSGLDPHTIHYNQALMRPHFELCIYIEKVAMFPTSAHQPVIVDKPQGKDLNL